ncbi:Syntaxin-61 [Micractinium conductrix]|uniref:Syntaxin-61 n=1 Tax=Micractinium conductrix TaxID=554055 RepID=A0A2P6VLH6_9CHLO|nr:Syntaxin-61 [Micractinium conductrix]|eukprot:PSC74939.1 Syntaxin-61 [Micractinium conductrix]
MAGQRDPYYIVKDEVSETIRGVQAKYARWQGAARGGADRRALAAELEEECHSLEYMVTEIDKSIDAAERNPARFNLSQAELSDRRKWVMGTRRQLSGIASGLSAGAGAAQQPTNAAGRLAAAVQDENERFIQTEGDRQQLLMQRQDEDLDHLSSHVVRIGELGKEMGQELHLQGQLLDELDQEIEGTSTRLQAAQKKIDYVLKKAGTKGQLAIIGFLILTLIVLIFLLLG